MTSRSSEMGPASAGPLHLDREQVFAALHHLGVPTRFVRYPASTSHGMSRSGPPDLRIHRLGENLKWWAKYLK